MVDTLPVNFNNDVLGFYHKQKSEFHFQQKTDNEFLMFLLDTAVRVISIVQHLAPVIEAVSEASNEAEEALDEEEYNLQQQINQQQLEQFNHQQNDVAVMEVDSLAEEVIKEQIAVAPPPPPIPDPAAAQQAAHQVNITHIAEKLIAEQLLESFNSQSNQSIPISVPIQSTAPSVILPTSDNIPISIPITQPSELIQQDEDIKSENNIPEIIEIKEEPSPQPLLPDDQLQQLMSSISSNEDNFRIQNFVPTAQPSNLPQSFLDRNTNPLSMLSLSSGSGGKPPPLLSAPFDSNLFSNISTDKLPGTSGALDTKGLDSKGNSSLNPRRTTKARYKTCPVCSRIIDAKNIRRHIDQVHLKVKPFHCDNCGRSFGRKHARDLHVRNMSCRAKVEDELMTVEEMENFSVEDLD